MIDVGPFQFGCCPYTNTDWYLGALRMAGFELPATVTEEVTKPEAVPGKLKVTLISNPFRMAYLYWTQNTCQEYFRFVDFLEWLPDKKPGLFTSMVNTFQADVVHRSEDCPWCLLELLASFDIRLNLASCLKGPVVVLPSLPEWVKNKFKMGEKELFDRYDYW